VGVAVLVVACCAPISTSAPSCLAQPDAAIKIVKAAHAIPRRDAMIDDGALMI
jgi:hypothetical protein